MITIDGSMGEGGGQVLRTALGLSLVTGRAFQMTRIRAGRKKPGILRQHLAAVRAAARIGAAEVHGDELGSTTLDFRPSGVHPGTYELSIGSAGSACLVLQTVLPALLSASAPTTLVIEGGTHNPLAPTFPFLRDAFAPLLARMGVGLALSLPRHGFAPAGGGRLEAVVTPGPLRRLELLDRGAHVRHEARALVAGLAPSIGRREVDVLAKRLGLSPRETHVDPVEASGHGNVAFFTTEHEHVTEVFAGFGQAGVRAEQVASAIADEAQAYLATDAPVGEYLADQLLLPMALGGGGAFRTLPLSLHARTQLEVIPMFLDVGLRVTEEDGGVHRVDVG